MGRLISPPLGLGVTSIEPLAGPRTVGQAETQSIGGYVQTVAAPFGLWRFRFSFPPMRDQVFRRYRGWVTALHGGANATRWDFYDPDMMSYSGAGVQATSAEIRTGLTWSNGQPWSNGMNWTLSRPDVSVAASVDQDGTIIQLTDQFWGHDLGFGDYIGFFPFHFGLYMVTEVLALGEYRIWPPLRKALTTEDFATLRPTLAMRLESEDAASAARGLVVADSLQVTMIEVLDDDLRAYFAG